jgi:hypothetical protein
MLKAVLLGYDLEQPSFRHRMRTLIGTLEAAGWEVRAERFPSGRYGLRTWERRSLLREANVVVLHQIKLSAIEARLFASLIRRRIFGASAKRRTTRPGAEVNLPRPAAGWMRSPPATTCWPAWRAPRQGP